ncbi:3'-5' exonuclease [Xanthomonas nasturtii]|uniref:3'-5' exonuclease n=2 Tax=Xanthomonas nasturtii TaxID=1843581 RepID=UPI002013A906|nr:3'-5' exonuclease [Xanthomonas nasturtii]MCL1524232.1 AAA family ATPase [Xanthomonas nasturtii]
MRHVGGHGVVSHPSSTELVGDAALDSGFAERSESGTVTSVLQKFFLYTEPSVTGSSRMKKLPVVRATGDQLPLMSQNRLGVEVICGAAGSGKTSTALLRLRSLVHMHVHRHERMGLANPVKVLVLTFNRTLSGYVSALVENQISSDARVDLEVFTFSKWAMEKLGRPAISESSTEDLAAFARRFSGLDSGYVASEAEYAMGRFSPSELAAYLPSERTGRGLQPRVDRALRRRLLDEVILPYQAQLSSNNVLDWNTLAVSMMNLTPIGYEIVIIDESQDFSANQLRAIRHHLAQDHTVTFVIDTVQRIYARGFTWSEAGFEVRPERYHRLTTNHRNTNQIANFAAGILNGINVDGDGALPNLTTTDSNGPIPVVMRGFYSQQISVAINFIRNHVDLTQESVAFLKPKGGRWFETINANLIAAGIGFVNITRESEWPEGPENVALCTFHSAKGLEFDYVFILGLSSETTPHGDEDHDDQLWVLRRLLAVAVARARKQVFIGYKIGEQSELVKFFTPHTFQEVDL